MSKETKDIYFDGVIYQNCSNTDVNGRYIVDSTNKSITVCGEHDWENNQALVEGVDYRTELMYGKESVYDISIPLPSLSDAGREDAPTPKMSVEEIIKKSYPFYDPMIAQKDVELNGEQVGKLMEEYASQLAASTNSGQGWISVEDKKPSDIEGYEEYDYFLCATEIGAIITGLCTYNEFTKQFYPATMSGYDDRIKFWQPLPEPPKQ